MKHLVIGIAAHVDSGKTTLSEALLYLCGDIRKQGRVDHGDAFLDTHSIERERGITVFAKTALLHTPDCLFTLLDTPGHVDFSAEAERALSVLDYAILVINGAEGIQSHTLTLWRLLDRYSVPVFIFINKSDLAGADKAARISELKNRLGGACVDFSDETPEFYEELAMLDDGIMESVLERETASDELIANAVSERKIFPCCFGSALRLDGVDRLISLLDRFTAEKKIHSTFGARVFKIGNDGSERLTYMKITGGTLNVRDVINGEKVSRLRVYSGSKFTSPDSVCTGMICAACGLENTHCGDGLGCEKSSPNAVLTPVLSYKACVAAEDVSKTLNALKILADEDPQLNAVWNDRLKEIHLQLMGEVQLDIIKRILKERFNISADFSQGGILYRETIAEPVIGVGHYEPLKHYAEAHILLEPLPAGSGVKFAADCREEILDKNWQRLVLTHLAEKTHFGVLTGSPITDIKLTLISGRAYIKHTEGGDFRQATYRAVRQGLRSAKSVLLEPWYDFTLVVPPENVGRAMSDLQRMNAVFEPPLSEPELCVITGSAPVRYMREYHKELISYSHGKGRLSCASSGYKPCTDAEAVIAEINYDCDADIENTADSVFCSHGAGYLVKWNHVCEYMHVKDDKSSDDDFSVDIDEKARSYCKRLATDKELLEIFERTYGPVKQKLPQFALRSPQKTLDRYDNIEIKHTTPKEYLLVDGYNIIFAWSDLKLLSEKSVDMARQRLTDILCGYQAFKGCELILVFDAYKVKGNPGSIERINGISVVYTKEAQTADSYIEKAAHDIAKFGRVRVATSDGMEQMIILGSGALRMTAAELKTEVAAADAAVKRILEANSSKTVSSVKSHIESKADR